MSLKEHKMNKELINRIQKTLSEHYSSPYRNNNSIFQRKLMLELNDVSREMIISCLNDSINECDKRIAKIKNKSSNRHEGTEPSDEENINDEPVLTYPYTKF